MSVLERTVRIGAGTGLRVDAMLSSALIAEVVNPSNEIWLVSPWITDIRVLDNSQGAYDSFFGDVPPLDWRLSEALIQIASRETRVHVVTRPDPHNALFLRRLESSTERDFIRIVLNPDVHEKTLCGDEWILTGSMNYTVRGMAVNDESVTYKVGGPEASQARLDLRQRWGAGA
ncbi:phospholipase D-like domain-containing protein DpdK [Streptomyces sp. NPDC001296]